MARPSGNPWIALLPALVLTGAVFLLPIGNMVRLSFTTPEGFGFGNFVAFFSQAHLRDALVRSVILATTVTALSATIAWPLAYFIAFVVPRRWRLPLLLLIIAPFWTSFTIRAFSWQLVLSDSGLIGWAIERVTGIPVSLGVLYTMDASIFGLTLFGVMLITLTLFSSMSAIERSLLEASSTLGGTPFRVARDVVVPLSLPGWVAGATLTFIIALGDYAVPTLLGGGLKPVLAQTMLSVVKGTYDLPASATMAVILAVMVIAAALPFTALAAVVRRR